MSIHQGIDSQIMEYTGIVSIEWTGTLAVLDTPTREHFPRMIKKMGRVFPKDHPDGAQQTLPLLYLPAPAPDFSHDGAQQMGIITDVWYDAPRDAYRFDDPAREQQHAPWLCASGIAYGDLAELLLTGEPVGVGVDLGTLAESVPAAVQTVTGPDGEAIQQLTRWRLLGATCYGPGHRGAFGDTAVIRAKTTEAAAR